MTSIPRVPWGTSIIVATPPSPAFATVSGGFSPLWCYLTCLFDIMFWPSKGSGILFLCLLGLAPQQRTSRFRIFRGFSHISGGRNEPFLCTHVLFGTHLGRLGNERLAQDAAKPDQSFFYLIGQLRVRLQQPRIHFVPY
ncbi:hypothetical protein FRC12_015352 [Ceratobasidium sp. 428]|nr:hypothetical protein FRC12_015352 [Ceratobasidium sp. 428]